MVVQQKVRPYSKYNKFLFYCQKINKYNKFREALQDKMTKLTYHIMFVQQAPNHNKYI